MEIQTAIRKTTAGVRHAGEFRVFGLALAEWSLLVAIFSAVGIVIAGLDHLEDLAHPRILGGLIGLLATHVGAWAAGLLRPQPHHRRKGKGRIS